ncbi:hypothetical protein ADK38_17310 [Streptomyces varsoviensis]|uniref:Uncharacterized protein n=1 Tax=Streptomyces varsoviensis TaxID=67373 RepID=A0ABR5J6C4_9ACTN|nr:hypothetical protein ADK38_17310 [Streptomyces varsoviensis]
MVLSPVPRGGGLRRPGHLAQQGVQAEPAVAVEPGERRVLGAVPDDAVAQRAPLLGELDDLHPAVGGVRHAADQAALLQPVDHRGGRRGVAPQPVGQPAPVR